jgi:anaphase-promoting complex subunit 1
MTFSTDNASVAALWMAMYPRFPQNASDNRCHLQAFRHLYALAARKRMLRAVDAKSGVDVTAPVEMRVRSGFSRRTRTRNDEAADEDSDSENITVVIRKTPCLLPDPDMLVSVAVAGDRYWPVSCDDAESLLRLYKTRTLPVQRLAGALPYAADPTGARAGAAASLDVVRARAALEPPRSVETTRNGNGNENGNENEAFEFATRASDKARARRSKRHGASDADSFGAFVSDPASVGFRRLMCDFVAEETLRKTTTSSSSSSRDEDDETTVLRARVGGERSRLASFCQSALRECAAREEPDAASAYVDVYAASIAVRVAVDRARKTRKEGSNTEPTSTNTASSSVALVPREPESAKLARVLALADVKLLSCSFGAEKDDDFEKENDATPSKEAPIMPRLLVSSFLETARDALDAMRFDAPRGELAAYYGAGASGAFDDSGGERKRRAGLFGAYLRFFRFPPAFAVRRALAKFGLGPPGSGLDPEAVAVALAVGLPGTDPAAALRVARCGL